MGPVTVPRPPDPPLSRRAARALRDEAGGRAPRAEAAIEVGRLPEGDPASPSTLPLPIILDAPPSEAPPDAPETRWEARAAEILEDVEIVPIRHARPRRAVRAGVIVGLAGAAALLLGSTAAVTAMVTDTRAVDSGGERAAGAMKLIPSPLPAVVALPVPNVEQTPATADICLLPEVAEALAAGDDEGAIVAAGGAEAFRVAVVEGDAPCISLADPDRIWVVVNKMRPYAPIDYRPGALVMPDDVRNIEGGSLRPDAASALTKMVAAAQAAGAGQIALESGFRSYTTQHSSYAAQVSNRGSAEADLVSARPGYSEHQSGLTADLIACGGFCGTLDDLAGSPQGAWLLAHSWEFGWITRYEDGHTATTGYSAEPWHLRYIGADLAAAYHAGGWHTLEEFFGLPPAPDYGG